MPKVVEVPGVGNVEFPDGMADADISRTIRMHTPEPTRGTPEWKWWALQRNQDLNGAAASPNQPEDKSFLRMLWDKVNPFQVFTADGEGGGDQPGQGPIGKTVGAIAKAQLNQGKQAVDSFRQGDYSSAVGHGVAAALPVVGPMAANFGEHAGEALGSMEGGNPDTNAAKEAATDALAAGTMYAVPEAGSIIERVRPGTLAAASDALRANAEAQYARVLNPTTNANKFKTAKIVPELIDRGVVARNLKGIQSTAEGEISRFGQAIGNAWDNLPPDTATEFQPIYDKLQSEIDNTHSVTGSSGKKIPAGPEAKRAIGDIQKLQETLMDVAATDPETGKLMLPVDKARFLRQYFDGVAENAGRSSGANLAADSTAQAHAIAADSIRHELAKDHPDIAALNKEYSFWKDVNDVVTATILRKQGQAPSLGSRVAQAAGYAKGGILGAEALKALQAATSSPGWGTAFAVLKDRLADALSKGQRGPAELYARRIAQAARNRPIIETGGANAESIAAANGPQDANSGAGGQPGAAGGTAADAGGPEPWSALSQPPGTGPETEGAQTSIPVPGSARAYAGQYGLRELSDIQPSHNGITFQPNPRYELRNDRDYDNPVNRDKIVTGSLGGPTGFDPRYHITDNPDSSNGPPIIDSHGNVLGGNGRTMTLQRVYGSNARGATAYRQLLAQRAEQFGLDPMDVATMKQPVLVRVIDDAELAGDRAKQDAVTNFNTTPTAALTPNERAVADSRRVSVSTLDDVSRRLEDKGPDATLAQVLAGRAGVEVLDHLVSDGVMSPQERAGLANQDGLTKAGKDRISALMLGRFFRDPAQLDQLPASLRNKMERIAGPLAKMESSDYSLTEHLKSAIDLIEEAEAHGAKSLRDIVTQAGMFGDQMYSPESVTLAQKLLLLKPTELTKAVREYGSHAAYARDYQGPGLIDFPAPTTPHEAFSEVFGTPGSEVSPQSQ
jgi:hypothetical protein